MNDNDSLKSKLEAGVKALKAKESYFAFSPDTKAPALMIQKRPLPPGKFRRLFAAEQVDINKGQIWVGTVKKDGGKIRFSLDAKGSAGSPKANKMAAGLKKLAKSCEIPKLRSAIIVSPEADVQAAEARDAAAATDPGMQRRGRYRSAFRTLDQLRQGSLDHKKRAKLNAQMQKESAGWLFDHALGKKKDKGGWSDDAKKDVWKLHKMSHAATGAPPTKREVQIAAHFMEGDLQAAIVHANTVGDPAASIDKLESVIADLELYLDSPPEGCDKELAELRRMLALAQEKLEAVQALDVGGQDEDAQDEGDSEIWTKHDRNGRLEVPADAEVIVSEDPGIKAKLGKSCDVFSDKGLTQKIGEASKGISCVMSKTDTDGVVKIELYKDKEGVGVEFTLQGYTGNKAVTSHFQKRSHKAKHDKRLFEAPPSIDDIQQGALGDCYMLAALGAIAKTDPKAISQMIRDNNDGTVTVRLFDVQVGDDGTKTFTPRYVQVEKSVHHKAFSADTERAGGPMWVQMIEKAFAAQGYAMQSKAKPDDITSSSYLGTEGGHANETLEVLLGRPAEKKEVAEPEPPWVAKSMSARLLQSRLPDDSLLQELGISRKDAVILSQFLMSGKPLPVKEHITQTDDMTQALVRSGMIGKLEVDYAKVRAEINKRRRILNSRIQMTRTNIQNQQLSLQAERDKLVDAPGDPTILGEIERLETLIADLPNQISPDLEDIDTLDSYLDTLPEDGVRDIDLDAFREQLVVKMAKNGDLAGPLGSGAYSKIQLALVDEIDDGLAKGACLGASTKKKLPGKRDGSGKSAGEPMSGGLVGSHVYTIVDITPPADEREDGDLIFVYVRNPWGSTGRVYEEVDGELTQRPTSSAVSKIELSEFVRNFSDIQRC